MNQRQQQRLATRSKILEAAASVFAELGFDAASMGEIAKRGALKKALVQYHFETKEQLWKDTVDKLWQERKTALPSLNTNHAVDDKQLLNSVLKQIILFAREQPKWVYIMFRESSGKGERLDWFIEHYMREDYDNSIRFVESFQQRGLLPTGSPYHLTHIICGALTYVLFIAPMSTKVTGVDPTSDSAIDGLVAMLASLLQHTVTTQEQL
jgi:AcrR family transcriptional regulator